MKFNKITLKNFRQYKGVNEIEFSTDEKKNITVVYGPITTGKTTLLQSFNWVLYNRINLQNPTQILNLEVERELTPEEDAEVFVELLLEDDDIDNKVYKFKRTVKYRFLENKGLTILSSSEKAYYKENDTWIDLNDYDEQVNKLLPSKLSNYFFFDGERIKVIGNQQKKGEQEVGEAVKSILGLEDFNTAIDHLTGNRSVLTELRNSMNSSADSEMELLKKKIAEADDKIDEKNQNRMKLEGEIDKFKQKRAENKKIIDENKITAEKQKEKEAVENRIERNKKLLEEKYNNFKKYFNSYNSDFFYSGLNGKVKEIQNSGILNIRNEAVPNMNDKSVQYLIKRGYCVCGEKLVEGDEHFNFLLEEMKKLPPREVGNGIADFNKDIKLYMNSDKSGYFKDEITRQFSEIVNLTNSINEDTDLREKISEQIKSNINVGALEEEVSQLEEKIEDYSRMVGQRNTEIENLKAEKQVNSDKLNALAGADEKNKRILKEIEYTNRISAVLANSYKKKEKELIALLESEINKYLDQIYAGNRIMKINSDYTFHLLYQDGDEIDSAESEGLGIVKAISFMCGLFEVAKKKLIKEINSESMYPLVFDAPLSNVGSFERKNIMHYLPEVASQIIVFTREEKDLEAIDQSTRDRIGATYNINKITEKHSEIEKEDI